MLPLPFLHSYGAAHESWPWGYNLGVSRLNSDINGNHREIIEEIQKLQRCSVSLTVISSAILPVVNQALMNIEGPAKDYDAALEKWKARVAKVDLWRSVRANKRWQAERAEVERKKEALIQDYIRENTRWWRRPTREEAEHDLWIPLHSLSLSLLGRDSSYMRSYLVAARVSCESRPKPPDGYEDLPAIREIQQAASISEDATLTVSVDSIKKLQRWA